ncbi:MULTISPECIES: DNA phosphorothioation-dependent restriction protein DptG [unclassified Clostridium]|uniref:DNA phosphorothioation-dependent restriction protein DptG n=1 Tax=unclassified Clostridium TaxID=2614128 RepID=UPI002A919C09|nr:DNA phosphorothioation-dependent restriction protein DptG [Clostridium sp.]MDY6228886.1 DNA phosphorothioation-dependent restriction protein DptG [Clostridium sp.]
MCEEFKYKLDLEEISTAFKFTEKGLTHKQGGRYKLLPYAANEKTLVSEFSGVVGAFSRMISNKELKSEFNADKLINEIAEQIGEYEGSSSKEVFKDIVRTMFIDGNNLVDFDIKTINYISATSADEKIAKFLFSALFDKSLSEDVSIHYDREIDNVLYRLVLNALPELKDKEFAADEYNCYLPFVRELFIKDLKFLLSNEELYKNSLKRFLEYYYMFYVSQLVMKLKKFEKADVTTPDKLYYTLSWESTSKNRTAYQLGWENIKESVNSLFSHAITLELLNYHNIDRQLGYIELADIFNKSDKCHIENEVLAVLDAYTGQIKDKPWDDFKEIERETEANGFKYVYKLFDAIEYQFIKSSRTRAYEAYRNWFVRFVYDNFAKRRGQLGYNLNMTEDDIILITKICINNKGRMKLNKLFDEFELRGIFFDRDSKAKIVLLYEKLNLLEKKSDSGDAQYVRSVL